METRHLRSCCPKRSKKGRRFPPRTVGLWFEEGIIDDFREAIAAENAEGIRRLLKRFVDRKQPK